MRPSAVAGPRTPTVAGARWRGHRSFPVYAQVAVMLVVTAGSSSGTRHPVFGAAWGVRRLVYRSWTTGYSRELTRFSAHLDGVR
ncbi:hypothetical protein CLV67_108260 [Actinoplanes italicus]|uniref:Uncharacterized protein n=1 Tax=Actinoplanes italicus TaxID=113567 RepID=A0A2T0KB91_9ACTN|nr:hypothetical protein CLV67_108260 [Actinoplanes italicus]